MRTVAAMTTAVIAVICLIGGAALGSFIAGKLTRRDAVGAAKARTHVKHAISSHSNGAVSRTSLNTAQLRRLFDAIPGIVILIDLPENTALVASNDAHRFGLVDKNRVVVPAIADMLVDISRGATSRAEDVCIKQSALTRPGRVELRVRAVGFDAAYALVFAQDVSDQHRVDEVRRDFVANVSHELKTPVGALGLLSEAILAAAEEPDEVRHFANRMQIESTRLAHLVTDIVDLSRLQVEDPMQYAEPVEIENVIAEAVDGVRTTAAADQIEIVVGGYCADQVLGVEAQLVTVIRNLLANAIAYSPSRTRIALGCQRRDGSVEITVTDQGIGIPASEQGRIFERFYRIDQARSRETGGTGLGLSIVKHVCQNHGGTVSVWSVPGEGSTFTVALPLLSEGDESSSDDRNEYRESISQ